MCALLLLFADSKWTTTIMPEYSGDLKLTVGFGKMTYVFDLDTGFDESRRVMIRNAGSFDMSSPTKTATAELMFQAPYKVRAASVRGRWCQLVCAIVHVYCEAEAIVC